MAKIRVYELAKQLSVSSKEVMDVLKDLGADVRSHQSGIDDSVARKAVSVIMKRAFKGEEVLKAVPSKPVDKTEKSDVKVEKKEIKQDNIKTVSISPKEQIKEHIKPEQKIEKQPVKMEQKVEKQENVVKVDSKVEPQQKKVEQFQPQKESSAQKKVEITSKVSEEKVKVEQPLKENKQSVKNVEKIDTVKENIKEKKINDSEVKKVQNFVKKDSLGTQQSQGQNKDGQNRNFRKDRDGKDGLGSQQGQGQNKDGQNRSFRRDRDGKDGLGGQQGQGQNRDGQNRNFRRDRDGKDGFGNKQGQNKDGQSRGMGGMKFDASMFQDKDKPEKPAKSSSRNQKQQKNYGMDMSLLGKPSQINQKQQRQRNEKKDKDFEELAPKKVIQKTVKKATPKKNVVKTVIEEVKPEVFEIAFPITIGELASILSLKSSDILMKLLQNGRMLAVNHSLDKDLIFSILDLFEIPHEKVEFKEDVVSEEDEEDDPRFMIARPPVVTILGHVDHGKTSLLDAIRKSNVTAGEAGGITQKIGAYVVEHDSKKIVFLDTPGHEAFTAMRARGAQVTDIAVLVVAADDGVMPQTIEAINHAKAAKVPIIVAINKIDKPGSNPERVKQQLSEHGLIPEDWGGDVICVPVSAKAKMGIDDLLEMITLVADIQELKANPRRRAYGVILESRLDKGLGCMATVLVQKGTLKPGDSVIAGLTSGKVRVLINERGERVKKATPSIPVEIVGLTELPNAGDILRVVKDDKMARQISDERQIRDRERHLVSGPRTTLQDIFKTMSEGEKKQLDVLIKADSNGSVEAIKHSLAKLPDDEVKVNVIHGAVGVISESDVLLARASNSLIIGFNIKMEANIKKLADQEKVAIRNYDVIYRMIEDIQSAMKGMLEPEYESVLTGTAEVRQLFKASKVGVIAGSYVSSGKVMRNSDLKIYRNKKLIHEGKIESLKRFKDDVREVIEGFECGITVENFNDIQVGDTIEAYIMKEKVR